MVWETQPIKKDKGAKDDDPSSFGVKR